MSEHERSIDGSARFATLSDLLNDWLIHGIQNSARLEQDQKQCQTGK
jgi:hypothetical protein